MYLVLGLAAAAVAVVLSYNRSHDHPAGGEVGEGWVAKAHQLAAVILVLVQAVEGLIAALDRAAGHPGRTTTHRQTSPAGYGQPRLADVFDDQDWR